MSERDLTPDVSLQRAAEKIAWGATPHLAADSGGTDQHMLYAAAQLQLHSLSDVDLAPGQWESLGNSPARINDFAIVLAALFESESAWEVVIEEVNAMRSLADSKFGAKLGSVTDDVIDAIVDHLRAEAPSRRHAPALRARLATYRGSASLRTWLRTVIMNRLRDSHAMPQEIPDGVPASTQDPDLQHAVQFAIGQLSPADQVFARLIHIYGEAQNDIAQLLKISPAAVSQRRKKIMEQLRESLVDYAIDPVAKPEVHGE